MEIKKNYALYGKTMLALDILEACDYNPAAKVAIAVLREYVEASTPVETEFPDDGIPANVDRAWQMQEFQKISEQIKRLDFILHGSALWNKDAVEHIQRSKIIEDQLRFGPTPCVPPDADKEATAPAAKVWTRDELKEQFALGECADVIEALEMAEALMGRKALCELIGCDGRMLGRALNGHPANNKIADYIKPLLPKMEEGDKDEL